MKPIFFFKSVPICNVVSVKCLCVYLYEQLVVVQSPAVGAHAQAQRRVRARAQQPRRRHALQRHARLQHLARPRVCHHTSTSRTRHVHGHSVMYTFFIERQRESSNNTFRAEGNVRLLLTKKSFSCQVRGFTFERFTRTWQTVGQSLIVAA